MLEAFKFIELWELLFSDRCLNAGFERTNAALFCARHKVNKLARRAAEFHGRCFFDCLTGVQSARVNQFERSFNFIALFCAESGATDPDYVQPKNIIVFGRDHERRNVFAKTRRALGDGEPSDPNVLVKHASASEECAVSNRNVTS